MTPYRIIANCRKDDCSTTQFKDKINDIRAIYHPKFLKNILVNIHGYGGDYKKVKTAYDNIFEKVNEYQLGYNAVMDFYWPASWSKTIGFLMARKRVKKASEFLEKYINDLVNRFQTENIYIQAHSLGCAVAQDLLINYVPISNEKLNFVYCAPAFTNTKFQERKIIYTNLKVGYSKNDPVLKYAFRLAPGNWFSDAIGYNPDHLSKLMAGFVDFSETVKTHTDYKTNKDYYELFRINSL